MIYRFTNFVFDSKKLTLAVTEGKSVITGRSGLKVLAKLLEHAPKVVSKNDLITAGWGVNSEKADDDLRHAIQKIRIALNDQGGSTYIETNPHRGYTFVNTFESQEESNEKICETSESLSLPTENYLAENSKLQIAHIIGTDNQYEQPQQEIAAITISQDTRDLIGKKTNYRLWTNEATGMTETLKKGWSWPAFLFGGLWALSKRMALIGIAMLTANMLIGYILATTLSDEDFDYAWSAASLAFSLLFGAYGNSWREWHLRRRGFVPGESFVANPTRDFLAELLRKLIARWRANIWSKLLIGLLVGGIGYGMFYWLSDHHPHTVVGCNSATLYGSVYTDGNEILAWFEWGETPDLGNSTVKQRFYEDDDYYQDIVDLKENGTYYYKAIATNVFGRADSRVLTFTTGHCQ